MTGAALILEPTSGLASLLGRLAALGSFTLAGEQLSALASATAGLEARIHALEQLALPTVKVPIEGLSLLLACIHVEASALWTWLEAEDATGVLALSPASYRHAAEELAAIGLVHNDVNQAHPSGLARTRLAPRTYSAAGPSLVTEWSVIDEMHRLLSALKPHGPSEAPALPQDLAVSIGVPLPRLNLHLRALVDADYLSGNGMGSHEAGSYHYVTVTPRGRRLLRGDDPLLL